MSGITLPGPLRLISSSVDLESKPEGFESTGSALSDVGLIIEADPDDPTSIQFRVPKEKSGTTNDRIVTTVSGSGEMGWGGDGPDTAFDDREMGEDEGPDDRRGEEAVI